MKVEILEVAGLLPAMHAMRLSWNSQSDSTVEAIRDSDLALLKKLIMAGDSHSKAFRLPVAYLSVTGTLSWWRHMDTYRYDVCLPMADDELAGMDWEAASESTMHTLAKRIKAEREYITEHNEVSGEFVQLFSRDTLYTTILDLVDIVNVDCVECIQSSLPGGFLQTRIGRLSYAALRRIYQDRHSHRLSEWREFCAALKQLPYSELITEKEW